MQLIVLTITLHNSWRIFKYLQFNPNSAIQTKILQFRKGLMTEVVCFTRLITMPPPTQPKLKLTLFPHF